MQIFARIQTLAEMSVSELLERFASMGFDGVELCLEHPELNPKTLTPAKIGEVRATLANLSLDCSVSWHRDYIHDDAIFRQMLEVLPLAAEFGARVFVISGGRRRMQGEEWAITCRRTRELALCAAEHELVLALEFEPGFVVGSTADLLQLFADVSVSALQANLDLGHVFLCDPDPHESIMALRGKIAHGHVENMPHGEHRHLPLWMGDMNLSHYLQWLSEIGFSGPLAFDYYAEDYLTVAERVPRYFRELLSSCREDMYSS